MDVNWTEERVETLRKLWADGLSASQIAAQLGSVSRNAVIGKVHRLKLSSRGRSTAAAPRVKKQASATTVVQKVKTVAPTRAITATIGSSALKIAFDAEPIARYRPAQDVVIPISRKLHLVELTERTCKWPNGDPLSEAFSFCGADSADTGPYCRYHSRIAFQPASERRRMR